MCEGKVMKNRLLSGVSSRRSISANQRRESQADKVKALLQCLVVVRSLMLVEGRKPVPNSQTIWWTLQQSTIELVKAEAKWHGKTPGVFAGQILAEVLQVSDSSR